MADRYFINGGVDNNWGSTANWSATSGGTGGASIPTAADAVFFDANSPNVTVNGINRVCQSLDFTGYTNTITMTFSITVSGNVTLVAAMGIDGASALGVNVNSTLTSNGRTWPNDLRIQSGANFADNWNVNGVVIIGNSSTNMTYNGAEITCNGGLQNNATGGSLTGTAKFILAGGIFSTSQTGAGIGFNIDYAGNITFSHPTNSVLRIIGGTHTYVSGTVTFVGTHTLVISASCTFDTSNSIIWKSLSITGNTTLTLTSSLYCDDVLTIGTINLTTTTINGTIYANSDFVYNTSGNFTLAGSGEIVMTGTGTISQGVSIAVPSFSLVIDTTGDITITSVSRWDLGKFIVRNAGSITTTEAWGLGGGGTFNPLQHPLIR